MRLVVSESSCSGSRHHLRRLPLVSERLDEFWCRCILIRQSFMALLRREVCNVAYLVPN